MATPIVLLAVRIETLEKQLALILQEQKVASDDKDKKAKKEKKEKKEKKTKKAKDETSSDDEDKPKKKRGPNGYILFSNANREDACAKLLVGDEKPKNTEVMKQLAQMWRALDDEEKGVWNTKAKETNASEVN